MIPLKTCAKSFCVILLFAFGLGMSAKAPPNAVGPKGQVLNHCDLTCDREPAKDKEGNYLFKLTKAKNTCDNATLKNGIDDAEGKSEKVELVCKCRFIAKYDVASVKKKPAEGDAYDFAGHTDGDETELGNTTILKATHTDLEAHGWVISVACIGTKGNAAVYKNNPKKKKDTP